LFVERGFPPPPHAISAGIYRKIANK